MSYYGGTAQHIVVGASGCAYSVAEVESAMFQRRHRNTLCFSHTHTERKRESHWRTQVSVQVIERDRRAPECHTWALGGQRRTGVGSTQPFPAQAFTMERNHQPGLAMPCQDLPTHSLLCVQSADSAVWKPCSCVRVVYVAVRVKKY